MWYRGDADELKQLYAQIPSTDAGCSRFWSAVPVGDKVRKLHTGLPGIMVDVLVGVVAGDYDGMTFLDDGGNDDEGKIARWDKLQEQIAFGDVLEESLTDTLVTGGGAFRYRGIRKYPMHHPSNFSERIDRNPTIKAAF